MKAVGGGGVRVQNQQTCEVIGCTAVIIKATRNYLVCHKRVFWIDWIWAPFKDKQKGSWAQRAHYGGKVVRSTVRGICIKNPLM